jgi:hypothetical protein
MTYASKLDEADKTTEAAKALGVQALTIQADAVDTESVVAAVKKTVGGVRRHRHPGQQHRHRHDGTDRYVQPRGLRSELRDRRARCSSAYYMPCTVSSSSISPLAFWTSASTGMSKTTTGDKTDAPNKMGFEHQIE